MIIRSRFSDSQTVRAEGPVTVRPYKYTGRRGEVETFVMTIPGKNTPAEFMIEVEDSDIGTLQEMMKLITKDLRDDDD